MALISKNSLEILKDKIDLVDIISSYIKLTRSGSHYKALCPFHSEKSPSFSISLGDKHYHCFGCGAHGDAISFLMEYTKLSFKEALSFLAERYQVTLENDKEDDSSKTLKKQLKEALNLAEDFYHFCLLHTYEGQKALDYARSRHLSLEFLDTFKLGFSPKNGALTRFLKAQGIDSKVMIEAGLLHAEKKQDFFFERFMIPIHDAMGQCIGFSARKLDPETFGGKYINTQETPLFKKSHVLFGLKFSRARIIKEKKAIVCEGQIDAMRLIFEGYDYTVASQGTAFGVAHVQMLKQLGVNLVYLAFDGDHAGLQAALKVGEHFMKDQITVQVLSLPSGKDPDSFLLECGKKAFDELLHSSKSYLEFLYDTLKMKYDLNEPSEKNRFINEVKKIIQEFNDPILIHESLKKLASLADVPERLFGIYSAKYPKNVVKQELSINKDHVLDMDVIRFFYLLKLQNPEGAELFIKNELEFESEIAKRLFEAIAQASNLEMMPFLASLDQELHVPFETLFDKKINRLKLLDGAKDVISKMLERSWLQKRKKIQEEIEKASDEKDQLKLTLKLTMLIKTPPKLNQ
jgi:DNA primase